MTLDQLAHLYPDVPEVEVWVHRRQDEAAGKCPSCRGSGTVLGSRGGWCSGWEKCWTCYGSGKYPLDLLELDEEARAALVAVLLK